jgi:hypothetical protein
MVVQKATVKCNDNICVKPETLTMSSIQCIMLHEQYAIYVLVYVHLTKKYCICTQPVLFSRRLFFELCMRLGERPALLPFFPSTIGTHTYRMVLDTLKV